jgi:hypothetical protein
VLAFLAYLQAERRNCAATRNCRLIAVHRFFAYVAEMEPQHAELCRRVFDIPIKKVVSNTMIYLERDEMKALLDVPRPSERYGLRDSALLTLMYNTGARAGPRPNFLDHQEGVINGRQSWNRQGHAGGEPLRSSRRQGVDRALLLLKAPAAGVENP